MSQRKTIAVYYIGSKKLPCAKHACVARCVWEPKRNTKGNTEVPLLDVPRPHAGYAAKSAVGRRVFTATSPTAAPSVFPTRFFLERVQSLRRIISSTRVLLVGK